MNTQKDAHQQLLDYLLQQNSPETMHQALSSLLTDTEYQEVINRLQIFTLLLEGKPQRQIAKELGVGIATVTRGAKALKRFKTEEQP